ncbi:hypothetical protein Nepgr_019827 [Nepenthes gracilis]|uniref:non-specific serine/threonine protein kinase n=1 Tax=Nepenthes gracilis TaxID=150966 RepID=A0AAD3XVR0_NEPGR|nr:hypothetical protein Nepgr_019827 [Nepenthes gracilis]
MWKPVTIQNAFRMAKWVEQKVDTSRIKKPVYIGCLVAGVNNHGYCVLEHMIVQLEDLTYSIQVQKVDALVIETFGRLIKESFQKRDVKPDDLLISVDGLCKVGLVISTNALSDPSASGNAFLDDSATQHSSKQALPRKPSVVITPDDLAPEILPGIGQNATTDCWSVGAILFELLVGIPPFNANSPQQNFNNNMNQAEGAYDISYFMSQHIRSPEDECVHGGSDFDEFRETGSDFCTSELLSNASDEDGEKCSSLADFCGPDLGVKYFSNNSSYKNLS